MSAESYFSGWRHGAMGANASISDASPTEERDSYHTGYAAGRKDRAAAKALAIARSEPPLTAEIRISGIAVQIVQGLATCGPFTLDTVGWCPGNHSDFGLAGKRYIFGTWLLDEARYEATSGAEFVYSAPVRRII